MKHLLIVLFYGLLAQSVNAKNLKPPQKQESSGATNWVASWQHCGGDGAIKRDGTLWQFGKIGYCNWGQITPLDPESGKPIYNRKYIYHLKGRRVGSGFRDAKIINGGYRVYAIKRDGTLWGWGIGLGQKPRLLSKSHNWHNFLVHYEGNGCCAYDIGLQKDGSLWKFPENVNFEHKNPMPYLKRVGNKKWDKVLIECCIIYAMAKDGSIWKNSYQYKRKTKFIKSKKIAQNIKNRLKRMHHGSMANVDQPPNLQINRSKQGGTLWLEPEIKY